LVMRTAPTATGTSDAFMPTFSGTTLGSFVGGIAAVRSETVMFLSTGAFVGVDLRTSGDRFSRTGLGSGATGGTQLKNSKLFDCDSSWAS
jgi:hypothetical protein